MKFSRSAGLLGTLLFVSPVAAVGPVTTEIDVWYSGQDSLTLSVKESFGVRRGQIFVSDGLGVDSVMFADLTPNDFRDLREMLDATVAFINRKPSGAAAAPLAATPVPKPAAAEFLSVGIDRQMADSIVLVEKSLTEGGCTIALREPGLIESAPFRVDTGPGFSTLVRFRANILTVDNRSTKVFLSGEVDAFGSFALSPYKPEFGDFRDSLKSSDSAPLATYWTMLDLAAGRLRDPEFITRILP